MSFVRFVQVYVSRCLLLFRTRVFLSIAFTIARILVLKIPMPKQFHRRTSKHTCTYINIHVHTYIIYTYIYRFPEPPQEETCMLTARILRMVAVKLRNSGGPKDPSWSSACSETLLRTVEAPRDSISTFTIWRPHKLQEETFTFRQTSAWSP